MAGPLHGDDCVHVNPRQRAEIFHSGTCEKGADRSVQQGKIQKDHPAGVHSRKTARLLQEKKDQIRVYLRGRERQSPGPEQHMEGDETPERKIRNRRREDIPPQSASSFRAYVLSEHP